MPNDSPVRWFGAEALLSTLSRVTLFCGGYGSGKTEIAVNFALHLAASGRRVSLADLDIVNPYFRSREVRAELRERGIKVLVPDESLVGADLPIVQPEIKGAVESRDGVVVLDVGGDPAGSRVLAGMAGAITSRGYASLFVVNSRRPQTRTAPQVERMIAEIGQASGVPVTGAVVNSHLIEETTVDTVREGIELARQVERDTGIPVAFVAVEERLLNCQLEIANWKLPVMVLCRHMLKPWEEKARPGPRVCGA